MTWVVGRGGRILYKADWTSAANVEGFVQRYREARRERPVGGSLSPYASEQLEFRHVEREMFYERLRRNGPRAYDEFKRAEELWSARESRPRRAAPDRGDRMRARRRASPWKPEASDPE